MLDYFPGDIWAPQFDGRNLVVPNRMTALRAHDKGSLIIPEPNIEEAMYRVQQKVFDAMGWVRGQIESSPLVDSMDLKLGVDHFRARWLVQDALEGSDKVNFYKREFFYPQFTLYSPEGKSVAIVLPSYPYDLPCIDMSFYSRPSVPNLIEMMIYGE